MKRSLKEIGRSLGRNKCKYCDYRSNDIEKVKEHEEKLHNCYRNKNPRKIPIKKQKIKVDSIWFARELPIHNSNFKIDVLYEIWSDGHNYETRMFTDDLKYGSHLEIIFDNKKQMYTIKNLKKLREEWNKKHGIPVFEPVGKYGLKKVEVIK